MYYPEEYLFNEPPDASPADLVEDIVERWFIVPGPIEDEGFPSNVFSGEPAPETAITTVVTIVTHHEIAILIHDIMVVVLTTQSKSPALF